MQKEIPINGWQFAVTFVVVLIVNTDAGIVEQRATQKNYLRLLKRVDTGVFRWDEGRCFPVSGLRLEP